jgi:hypothetical protein
VNGSLSDSKENAVRILLWIAGGGAIGLAIPAVMMQFEKPGDGVGIFVMLTLPLGLFLGAVFGIGHAIIAHVRSK